MLSRIAESLFWIGRYVERADGTARIVDVMRLQTLEESHRSEESAANVVLSVIMGQEVEDEILGFPDVVQRLVFDAEQPGAIASSWRDARENARRARETLSTELWEVINASWHRWRDMSKIPVSAHHLSWVRERAALVNGIADSTMSHDAAWDFLVLGRCLERADMTARIVATGALPQVGTEWSTVLQTCGAQQAYLRTNRGMVTDDKAAAFLVLDRQFPRSVLFALHEAEARLAAIDPASERIGIPDEARRRLGRMRTSLEYREVDRVIRELPEQMERVQQTVTEASDAIAARYFPSGNMTMWTEELL